MFGNKKIFVLGGFAPHPLLAKTGFSRESTPLIRERHFSHARASTFMVNEWCTRACDEGSAATIAGLGSNQLQMPSLDLSRSLTACGLALPPDDFITWPTNQPTS